MTHLKIIRLGILFLSAVSLVAGLLFLSRLVVREAPPQLASSSEGRGLPKRYFRQDPDEYAQIKGPFMELDRDLSSMQLPSLKNVLHYLGSSQRPDLKSSEAHLKFALLPGVEVREILQGEPLYLVTETSGKKSRYRFAAPGVATPLWVTAELVDEEVVITTHLLDEGGGQVIEPLDHLEWKPKKRSGSAVGRGKQWTLGEFVADRTILNKQKLRWSGQDLFLKDLGGADYALQATRERIQFGEGESRYVIYLKEGEGAVFVDGKWVPKPLGVATQNEPLLYLKEMSGTGISFELWGAETGEMLSLRMQRSPPDWSGIAQMKVTFSSVRTRRKVSLSVGDQLLDVSVQDWLLIDKGFVSIIDTLEKLEGLVAGRDRGVLCVLRDLLEESGEYYLEGTFYDGSRSASQAFRVRLGEALHPNAVGRAPTN